MYLIKLSTFATGMITAGFVQSKPHHLGSNMNATLSGTPFIYPTTKHAGHTHLQKGSVAGHHIGHTHSIPHKGFAISKALPGKMPEPEPVVLANTTMERKCFQVPFSMEHTCYREIKSQQPYPCPRRKPWENCIEELEDVPATCHRTVTEEVTYPCPKVETERLCSDIPVSISKKCKQSQPDRIGKPCSRQQDSEICLVVADDADDECYEVESYEESYDCWSTESTTECNVESELRMKKCTRQIQFEVPYTYEGMETERQCRIENITARGNCQRQVERQQQYPCPEIVQERQCRPTTRLIQKPCTDIGSHVETFDCSEQRQLSIEKTCHRTIPKKTKVQRCDIGKKTGCDEKKRQLNPMICKPLCVEEEIEYMEIETYPCTENTTAVVPKICSKEVPTKHTSMCVEEVSDEFCFNSPRRVEKMCKRPVIEMETIPCSTDRAERICEDVPKAVVRTGFRYETREEQYDCPDTDIEEKCFEVRKPKQDKCTATLLREKKVDCKRQIFREQCETKQLEVSQTCYEDGTTTEDFKCFDYTTQQKCLNVPVYRMGECSTMIEKDEEYPCTRKLPKTVCSTQMVPVEHTCFRESSGQEPYKCFEKIFNEQCVDLPLSGPPPPKKECCNAILTTCC